jgi:hypothetical protein
MLFLLAACAPTVTFIPTNSAPHVMAARPVSEVAVFTSERPERPFVEVGIVTAEAARGKHGVPINGMPQLIAAVRERAAEAGCDAVLMGPASSLTYQATCILYR